MSPRNRKVFTCFEAFAGLGGSAVAMRPLPMRSVGASEIYAPARAVYWANHGTRPLGDIREVDPEQVEPFDILFSSNPCTPYSKIGKRTGLAHPDGALVFALLPLVRRHLPKAIVWENVGDLAGPRFSNDLLSISSKFERLGYHRIRGAKLNSAKFGLATQRVRFYAASLRRDFDPESLEWPDPAKPMVPLRSVLLPPEEVRDLTFKRTDYIPHRPTRTRRTPYSPQKLGYFDRDWRDRFVYGVDAPAPTFCHYNSGPGGSSGLYDVDGVVRKASPREMLRAMGFPEDFIIPMPYAVAAGMVGNSITPPVLTEVFRALLRLISGGVVS